MSTLPASRTPDVLAHIRDSLRTQWRRFRKRLKDCQKHFSEDAVHDSRVATRRLLATLELLDPFLAESDLRKTRSAFKHYLDLFGDLRDTQVQFANVAKLTTRQPAAAPFCKWLRKREDRFTRKTCKAIKNFKTKPLARRLVRLEREIQSQRKITSRLHALDLILQSLALAFARTMRLQLKVKPDEPATIHRVRIEFKHYRYTIDALAPLLPTVTGRHRQAMRRFQSLAGDIQDSEVLLATFEKFSEREKIKTTAADRLRRELVRRHQHLIGTYLTTADHLLEACPHLDLPAPAPR